MMNGIVLVSAIIMIIINIIILMYILDLEKEQCMCSKHWMRDFIKYWTMLMIVVGVLLIIVPSLAISCVSNAVCRSLYKLYSVIGLVYIVVLIVYYFHLNRKTDCACALDWKRHALLWPIAVLCLGFLVGAGSAIFGKPINRMRNNRISSKKSSRKSSRM
jgi:hypothetical protein